VDLQLAPVELEGGGEVFHYATTPAKLIVDSIGAEVGAKELRSALATMERLDGLIA
jgi:hypothetical protein